MITSSTSSISTAAQLAEAGDLGRCELVQGELRMMSPSGRPHGRISAKLAILIGTFVDQHNLGEVAGAEAGFLLATNPDTVRAPDCAFIRKERLADQPEQGFYRGAPDLAVEVLSPNDRASDVLAKVRDWLDAGAIAVWVVDPQRKTIAVHRSDQPVHTYDESQSLAANDELPGFTLAVRDVFAY